jgi:hypothetical protein
MNSLASLVQWSLSIIVHAVDINTASSNKAGHNIKVTTTAVT